LQRREFLRLASITTGVATLSGSSVLDAATTVLAESSSVQNDLPKHDIFSQVFVEPQMRYRPMVRWWWDGDRVVGSELLRELDVLKAAGIGGVEINPIKFPGDAEPMDTKPMQWLSGEWIDVLEVVLKGARERDMTCDMIVGSGWPFGGEFLAREDQTQMIALGTRDVTGPLRLVVSRAELLKDVSPAFVSPQAGALKELFSLALAPYELTALDQVKSLNADLGEASIVLDIPEGRHVLYSLVRLTGYMAVINGAPGASGPVLNHLDKGAVERYLNHLSDALTARIGDLHSFVRAFFTDSIELEGANWFDGMAAMFQQRHGYDLLPWLPLILFKVGEMGNAVSGKYGAQCSPEFEAKVEAVRYDFQTLRQEVFNEHFVATFVAWCARLGVKSRMQAYGSEVDVMTASQMVDIPECETWLRSEKVEPFATDGWSVGRSYTMINKFVSSAAHLSGKQLISCEEMTNTDDPFGVSLNRIKAAGDQSILSGVTQDVLHGFNYSPPEIPFPGWVRYGTYFSEHNTWWPYFHLWASYRARISGVLQNSVMQADIAILPPRADLAARFGFQRDPFPQVVYPEYLYELWEVVHQNGSGCDYVTEEVIVQSEMKDGQLHYRDRRYKALLLPEVERIAPDTAKALMRFVAAGGTVLFLNRLPAMGEGMAELADADAVTQMIGAMQQKYPARAALVQVDVPALVTWYAGLQRRFKLAPDVQLSEPAAFVSQVHYRQGEREIFFISNYSVDRAQTVQAQFANVQGRTPWLWDAQTGERHPLQWSGGPGALNLVLGPIESLLIVFEPGAGKTEQKSAVPGGNSADGTSHVLKSDWQVSLKPVSGASKSLQVTDLKDPALDAALSGFAGTITCTAKVKLDASRKNFLELGVLHDVSEVWVNGRSLGVRWFGDQTYDLTSSIVAGENDLKIELTTTLGNYVKTLTDNKTAMDWSLHTPTYPSGFVNDVLLRVV
jgi:hypothetical protein